MTLPHFFLDIGTLYASQPSGIPALVRALGRHLLREYPDHAVCCHDGRVLAPAVATDLLAQDHGAEMPYLDVLDNIYCGEVTTERRRRGGRSAAIFPLARPGIRQFDHETQLICDLTPVLFPDWHTPATCATFARMLATLAANNLIVTISASARADLLAHTQLPAETILISHPGLASAEGLPDLAALTAGASVEPFLLVLGTIEPRKNIDGILRFLAAHPGVLDQLVLVVAGAHGWGPTLAEMVARYRLPASRIVHTGFVSEAEKQVLLATATMLLFPSHYEGFGLPVVEALAAGCPVLASRAGGIPEAGGDAVTYCQPGDDADFARAFFSLQQQLGSAGDRAGRADRGRRHAAAFTADRFAATIVSRITADLARQ
ncbi:MAG TPA: glycosyltransferase [bacterium]|nr:glycosyltransferase [bacterium]